MMVSKIRLYSKINDEYRKVHNKKPQKEGENMQDGSKAAEPNYEEDINTITSSIQNVQTNKPKTEPKKPARSKNDVSIMEEPVEQTYKTDIEQMIEEMPKTQQDKLSKIPKKFLIFGKKEEAAEPREMVTSTALQVQGGEIMPYETARTGTVAP